MRLQLCLLRRTQVCQASRRKKTPTRIECCMDSNPVTSPPKCLVPQDFRGHWDMGTSVDAERDAILYGRGCFECCNGPSMILHLILSHPIPPRLLETTQMTIAGAAARSTGHRETRKIERSRRVDDGRWRCRLSRGGFSHPPCQSCASRFRCSRGLRGPFFSLLGTNSSGTRPNLLTARGVLPQSPCFGCCAV